MSDESPTDINDHRLLADKASRVIAGTGPPKAHAFPNGTVSVKLHKRKRLTLVVAREELDAALIDRVELLEHENRLLRRKVMEQSAELRAAPIGSTEEEPPTKFPATTPWEESRG